ncbi:hypothetical protein OIU76_006132 [Salix suchowensis]|nr:hypothetical protein OIU76_006132 [Salix suchowensis]
MQFRKHKASVVQTTVRSLGTQMSTVIQLLEARRKTMHFSHDIVHRVTPFYHDSQAWDDVSSTGLESFPYWLQLIFDMIKNIFMNTGGGSFEKVRLSPQAKLLFGKGLMVWSARSGLFIGGSPTRL